MGTTMRLMAVVALVAALGCSDESPANESGSAGADGTAGGGGSSGGDTQNGGANGGGSQAGTVGTISGTGGGAMGGSTVGSTGGSGGTTTANYNYCANLGWHPNGPADCSMLGNNTQPLFKDGYRCIVCSDPARPAGIPDCWYSTSRTLCVVSCGECAP